MFDFLKNKEGDSEQPQSAPLNNYDGEIAIPLYNKTYPMKITMDVIAQYQSEPLLDGTTPDYHNDFATITHAIHTAAGLNIIEMHVIMTAAVSMEKAVRLFYLAANAMDSFVTLDEMQEAVMYEGSMQRDRPDREGEVLMGYPYWFGRLTGFASLGVLDETKKSS